MPKYFVLDSKGNKRGPFDFQQLQTLVAKGNVRQQTSMESDTGHKGTAGQISGLFTDTPPEPVPKPPQPVDQTEPKSVPVPLAKTSAEANDDEQQFHDVNDIFGAFGDRFGSYFGDKQGQQPQHGADVRCDLTIDLHEAAQGVTKEITFQRHEVCGTCGGNGSKPGTSPERCLHCDGSGQITQTIGIFSLPMPCPKCRGKGTIITDPCPDCRGQGVIQQTVNEKLKIPAGADTGMRLRIQGEGNRNPTGKPPGDCYVFISVKPHSLFHRTVQKLHKIRDIPTLVFVWIILIIGFIIAISFGYPAIRNTFFPTRHVVQNPNQHGNEIAPLIELAERLRRTMPAPPEPPQPVVAEGKAAGERMVLTIQDVEYAFRWCPPGTFMMGSPASEEGRKNNERQHQVTLSRGFWMLETEVTQEMWEKVMGNNPSEFKGIKLPVDSVSWNDSQEYIKKLNVLFASTLGTPTGYNFSLPTEAQWEYACRAGTTTAYHFGNMLSPRQEGFRRNSDVGNYPANDWGLYDMHGNVHEWCADRWSENYPSGAVTDPTGGSSVSHRVARGGSWGRDTEDCRSASRISFGQSLRHRFIGFRLCLAHGDAVGTSVTVPQQQQQVAAPPVPAPSVSPQPVVAEGKKAGERMVLKIQDVDYAFRWCPPGTFMMGSPASERGRSNNEMQHRVTLSRGFWMLETEVTQAMWASVMGNEPRPRNAKNVPVDRVSWNDCQEYIKELNDMNVAPTGYKFSLPTEAQWEYACRAGTTTAYHFGDTFTQQQANAGNRDGSMSEVGKYSANAWGLYDMHGNVLEWCADWYERYPSGAVTDPTGGDSTVQIRVIRSGLARWEAETCRSAWRSGTDPTTRLNYYSLRLSLVLAE